MFSRDGNLCCQVSDGKIFLLVIHMKVTLIDDDDEVDVNLELFFIETGPTFFTGDGKDSSKSSSNELDTSIISCSCVENIR